MPFPADFGVKMSGKRKLSDDDVIFARQNIDKMSCRRLANLFGVAYSTMNDAIKGLSYRHLNEKAPPQQ